MSAVLVALSVLFKLFMHKQTTAYKIMCQKCTTFAKLREASREQRNIYIRSRVHCRIAKLQYQWVPKFVPPFGKEKTPLIAHIGEKDEQKKIPSVVSYLHQN